MGNRGSLQLSLYYLIIVLRFILMSGAESSINITKVAIKWKSGESTFDLVALLTSFWQVKPSEHKPNELPMVYS